MFIIPYFYNKKMNMRVCPHRNAFGTAVNTSDELLSVRVDAFVGSRRTEEGLWNTSQACTVPEVTYPHVQEKDSERNWVLSLRLIAVMNFKRIY